MPISFEQPSPVAYGESQGFIQQQNANRDFALRSFAAQSNDRSSRQASQNQQDALAQRRDEFEAQQQPSGRDLFIAQNQVNEQGMRIQAAAALQESQFTHADNIRLQRLRQGISHVNEQEQNGSLNPQDAQAYRFELMTGIDPLERQRRAAQVRQEQEQVSLIQSRTAHIDALDTMRRQNLSRTGAEGLFRLPDPNNPGESLGGWFTRDNNGNPVLVEGTSGGESTGNSSSRSRSGGSGGGSEGINPATILSAIASERNGDAPRYGTPELQEAELQNRIGILQRAQARMSGESRQAAAGRPGGPLPFDPQPTTTSDGGTKSINLRGTLNSAIERAMQGRAVERETGLRSIAAALQQGVPTGAMSPQQQQALQALDYYRGEFTPDIDRSLAFWMRPSISMNGAEVPIPPKRREDATAMQTLLARYGSREAMPAQARADFDATRADLGFTTWPPPPPSVPNSPPVTPVRNRSLQNFTEPNDQFNSGF